MSLNLANYRTIFDDNFAQDTSLDHSLWTDSWGETNQFAFGNGALTLSGYAKPYWNPVAIMQHSLDNGAGEGYGLYSFSGYANAGQGIGINFVMWRADNTYLDPSTPNKATEIDILESWDGTKTGQSTIHYYNASGSNSNGQEYNHILVDPSKPHTYTMDWERGSLTYYVDGQQMYQDTIHAPLDAADGGSNEVMGAQIINETSYVTTSTVQLHITDMSYSAPISDGSAAIVMSTLGKVQEISPGAGVTTTEMVAAPGLTGTLYAEVLTASGAVESGYQAEVLGLHHTVSFKETLLHTGDVIHVVDSLTSPKNSATSSAVTITEPVATKPVPTITVSAPGTVQEASVGAGVTVAETVKTTNLTGSIYEEVVTSSGSVETPYFAVAIAASGTTSFTVHLANSGDKVRVVDNASAPTVTATSSAVTITDLAVTPTIALSAPGTLQETSAGAGVTVSETATTTGLTGNIYEEVLTSSGSVETAFAAVAVSTTGKTIFSVHMAHTGDVVKAVDNMSNPKATSTSSAVTITDPAPVKTMTVSAPGTVQEASVGAGVTIAETVTTTGLSGSVYAEVLNSSGSVETAYSPVALSTSGAATFSVHLAKTGDTVRVVDNVAKPLVTATSSAVTITDPVVIGKLTGVLPKPLYTGVQTVTGTGGVAGLQLERITQGTYNMPGQSGWVKATVASNGNWKAQLTFNKPGMLAHVYAENGGSKTVVDLVNGTPATPPITGTAPASSLKAVVAGMQLDTMRDMSAAASATLLSSTSQSHSPIQEGGARIETMARPDLVVVLQDHHTMARVL